LLAQGTKKTRVKIDGLQKLHAYLDELASDDYQGT